MYKYIAKVADKLFAPIIILNIAAIASVFYNRGKLDAMVELEAMKENSEG